MIVLASVISAFTIKSSKKLLVTGVLVTFMLVVACLAFHVSCLLPSLPRLLLTSNLFSTGGGGGIRTHGGVAPTSVFKTDAFNHSATPPG